MGSYGLYGFVYSVRINLFSLGLPRKPLVRLASSTPKTSSAASRAQKNAYCLLTDIESLLFFAARKPEKRSAPDSQDMVLLRMSLCFSARSPLREFNLASLLFISIWISLEVSKVLLLKT